MHSSTVFICQDHMLLFLWALKSLFSRIMDCEHRWIVNVSFHLHHSVFHPVHYGYSIHNLNQIWNHSFPWWLFSLLVLCQHHEATFTVPPWADTVWRCPFYALGAEVQVLKWQLLKMNQLFLPDFSELLASFSAQYVQIGFHSALTSVGAVNAQHICSPSQDPSWITKKIRAAKWISVKKKKKKKIL